MKYLPALEPIQFVETDPLSQQYIHETLVSAEGVTDDTYNYYVDMSGYRKAGFQFELICDTGTITVTLEGTMQDDGTAAASCTYQDITNDVFGVASLLASGVAVSDMWIDNDESLSLYKYIKVKVVTSTSDDADTDVTIYSSKLY